MDTLQSSPVTSAKIKQWTDRDPLLSHVRRMVLHGWHDSDDPKLCPFTRRKEELSVQDGCVLWGSRVVVPEAVRSNVLEVLHQGHPGISRSKSLARSIVWWPRIDNDLKEKVKGCLHCQSNSKSPAPAPLHRWEWPSRPWTDLHIDHTGPFLGKMFLIVVDAHSKWMDVVIVPSTTSQCTIKALRTIFATHGLPEIIVSDNGSAFTSELFQAFTKQNGIRHVRSAPYHPASNGLAERAVQTFKEAMKRSTTGDLETRLSRFLFQYRITPHTTTGIPPAELLLGRRPRSHLDLMRPQVSSRVQANQHRQKVAHDQHARSRSFDVDDPVFGKNFADGPTWLPGAIIAIHGPLTYDIQLEDGRVIRRHVDHIQSRTSSPRNEIGDDCLPNPTTASIEQPRTSTEQNAPQPELRRSTRVTRLPDRYM